MSNPMEELKKDLIQHMLVTASENLDKVKRDRDALMESYPTISAAIHRHFQPFIEDTEQQLRVLKTGEMPEQRPLDIEAQKREYWELLTLLSSADPDLPIVDMHDRFCADADAAELAAQNEMESIHAITDDHQHLMYDVRLHLALGENEEAAKVQEEFQRRHAQD